MARVAMLVLAVSVVGGVAVEAAVAQSQIDPLLGGPPVERAKADSFGKWVALAAVALVYGFGFSLICDSIATYRGNPSGQWMILGFLFGPLALLALLGDDSVNPKIAKRCPECLSRVKVAAKVCRFCRHEFVDNTGAEG